MIDVAELQIKVDSKGVRGSQSDLENLERQGRKTQDRFTSFGQTAQRLSGQLTRWLTLPIVGAGAAAIKTASDYETLKTQLEVLVGSAETANTVFTQLTDFAATTPFEIDGIVKANNLLLGFGVSIDQTQSLLKTLGDVAAVSGGDLFSMARVFGEARAEGRLLTRDLRQLVAQGVPAPKLLAESMGVAESAIFDLASQGEITFERLVESFQMATAEGGLFFEGMQKRSNTLAGIFSNFADSVSISLGSVGQTLIDTLNIKGLMRDLVSQIERGTEWFNELDASTQRMIISFGLLLAAAGPVIGILGTLSIAIGAISGPVAAVVAAVAVGTAAIITHWEDVEAYFTRGGGSEMWESLQNIVKDTVNIVTRFWEQFGDEIMTITTETFGIILDTVTTTLKAIETTVSVFASVYGGEYRKAFDRAEEGWRGHMSNVKGIVERGLLALRDFDVVGGYKIWEALGLIPSAEELKTQYSTRMQQAVDDARSSVKAPEPVILDAEIQLKDLDTIYGKISDMEIPSELVIPFRLDTGGTTSRDIEGMYAVAERSIAGVEEDLRSLQNQFRHTHDAQERAFLGDQIESYQERLKLMRGEVEGVNQTAKDLGFTFSSAFEDAIVNGNSFRDVLDGIFQDLLRISTRKLITEPLGNALSNSIDSGWLSKIFGKASGGPVTSGTTYMVGEKGPELFTAGMSGMITPNHKLSGGGGSPVNISIKNINQSSNAEVHTEKRQKPNGEFEIVNVVRDIMKSEHNSGRMDRTMKQYGISRQPTRRG